MSPPTDLQKKDELRRERRFLIRVKDIFVKYLDKDVLESESIVKDVKDRIEDIEKALED